MKKITITFFVAFTAISTFAQNITVVILNYQKTEFFKDSFRLEIRNAGQPEGMSLSSFRGKLVGYKSNEKSATSVSEYTIPDTVCTIFGLGFGHEIIALPNDTITLTINPAKSEYIGDGFYSPWLNEFSYEGKNKFIYSLFDSLAFVGGELIWGEMSFKSAGHDLNQFYQNVTDCYNRRMLFLKEYSTRHSIPTRIQKMAESEIYSAYIKNLFTPFNFNAKLKKEELPQAYLYTLNNAVFNDGENYFASKLYKTATYCLAQFNSGNGSVGYAYSDSGMTATYNYIKEKFRNDVRDDLLALHLRRFIGAPDIYPSFEKLLTDYKVSCKNEGYISFISLLFEKKKKEVKRIITLEDALASSVEAATGKASGIKSLLQGKPLLIDCWASWCGPCLGEMPFTKELEKKFRGKVDFVYLSFDRNRISWKAKVKELHLSSSCWLANNFKSDFALHFSINSIPRYILISKEGKIIDANAPRPSDKALAELMGKIW